MLAKLTTLVKSKVALAAIGAILVGGSGGAVALAAHGGQLQTLGVNLNVGANSATHGASGTPDSHAHTIGVEGKLAGCNTTAQPATISVTDQSGKSWTFVITSTTRFNGDEGGSEQGGAHSGATPEATDSAHTGANTSEADSTRTPGANENDHETGSSLTLASICAVANINSRQVQVQATPDGANYDAWKVTLQGANQNSSHSGDNSGKGGDSSSHSGSTTGSNATDGKQFEGVVTAVSASGFTLKSVSGSYTVTVNSTTHFDGSASLSDIHVNAHVAVQGALSGQTITATAVEVGSSTSSNSNVPNN